MLITIPGLLPADVVEAIVRDIESLPWHPGDSPDPEYAEHVKRNLELKEKDSPIAERHLIGILRSIMTNREFRARVFPYKAKTPQFNKYAGGGAYHRHSDSALMGRPEIRTDVSITVFLSDPADYDGGELTLEYPTGEVRRLKEPKGTLVCYQSQVLHYVAPVTRGARLAAVTWVQSYVRAEDRRSVLASTLALSQRIKAREGLSDTYAEIFSIHNNLFRMWSEF